MYPIPPTEHLIETKVCRHCSASFPITDKDLEFYEKVSPTFEGKKYQIPTPTLCPDCRQQRRLSFRNERKVFFRNCDKTGRRIFSMYSPDKTFPIYDYPEWYKDDWNPLDYGRDFDFSRPFFEQFHELDEQVPKMSLSNLNVENSEYVSMVGGIKDCYLVFNADTSEHCYYGKGVYFCKNSVDTLWIKESEHCYECVDCVGCHKVFFGQTSMDCRDCRSIFDCVGCTDCVGCVSLRNKSYCINNIQYTKEEYKKKLMTLSDEEIRQGFEILKDKIPKRENNNLRNESVTGEYITDSHRVVDVFDVFQSKDIKYCTDLVRSEDVQDVGYYGMGLAHSYESVTIGQGYNMLFCNDCWNDVRDLTYCFFCVNGVSSCFGCVGLHNGEKYCIFNEQYTREEYEQLVPQIIEHMMKTGEWGEFFSASLSPIGYNESVAIEYFDKSQKEALSEGFNWSDYEAPFPKVDKTIPAKLLPDNITDIPDDILNWAIECEVSGKPFRIIKQELDFYRKHNLPIPRRHPDQRHLDRMAQRNPRKLFERKCDKCHKSIITTYAPDRKEIVYCEECYNREVIG